MASLAVLSLVSCQTGPPPVRMGTPAWFWAAAKEQYAAGDFAKTQEHLEKLMAGESEYKTRAATWHLVVLAGMARGYRELADAYETGAPGAKAATAEFRRTVNDHRRTSRQYSIGLAEEVGRFLKEQGSAESIALEFAFPSGSSVEPPTLLNIRKGLLPQESDRASTHRQSIARGVVLQAADVVGEDPAKAQELFKTQPVQVSRAVFFHGLAKSIVEQSALFDRKKLQEPDKKKILLDLAANCAKIAAEAATDDASKKKIKELQTTIDKEQKNIGKT
jgi:hypothetical protein